MKKRINKKKINNLKANVAEEVKEEPTIDGEKLTDIFGENENLQEYVKIEKKESEAEKDIDIHFDPNADVKLKKKKSLTLKIVSWVAVCCLIVCGGYFGTIVGQILIGRYFTKTYDPNAVSEADYRETDETIEMWKKLPITSLSASQVFVVAEAKLNECTYYSVTTQNIDGSEYGRVSADVPLMGLINQTLKGYRYRNGDEGYFDYYSSGFTDVIKKSNFTYSKDEVFTYNLKNGEWVLEKQRTKEEFKTDIGVDVGGAIDYIISTKTVLTEVSNGVEGGNYSYTITLDPKTAVANYAKKMDYMAGLGYPTFESAELTFVVDSEMNFKQIYVKEKYDVPGLAKTDAEFMYQFEYENIKIVE